MIFSHVLLKLIIKYFNKKFLHLHLSENSFFNCVLQSFVMRMIITLHSYLFYYLVRNVFLCVDLSMCVCVSMEERREQIIPEPSLHPRACISHISSLSTLGKSV